MIVPTSLYINLENTLIPRTMFPKMLSDGKESYSTAINSMDPRVALVAPAKDWVMFAIANPKLIESLRKRGITIVPTLFSHVLPDAFPETLELQYGLSSDILKKFFENISWSGIIPENTVSSTVVAVAKQHWEKVILSVGHNNLRGLLTGSYILHDKLKESIPLQVVANASARMKYMQMYREEVIASTVLEEMESEDIEKACLFDFERPWSNVVYFPYQGESPARIDVWKRFHRKMASLQMKAWDFPEYAEATTLELGPADLSMWENQDSYWLIDIQKGTLRGCLGRGDYFELAALVATSCMPPRVLTRFMNDDSFPSSYRGKVGVVDLTGDVSKVQELLLICKNIQQKRRVDYGAEFLPEGSQLYLQILHKALVWIDRHIA